MTEVIFRPLEALKLSMTPKKMEGFHIPGKESDNTDEPSGVDSENNETKQNEMPLSKSNKYLHVLN